MKNFNNINIPCEINGTSIASECGMFDHIYRNHKEKKFTYSNINLHSDGSLEINVFIPNVSKYEYEDFMSKPMRFYNKKLPNGAYQTSIRGATSMDVIKIPFGAVKKVAEYELVYEDGTNYTEDILYGTNIYKYRSVYGDVLKSSLYRHNGYAGTYMIIPECGKTYNGEDYTLGEYSIKNPYPEKKICKIKFKHTQNVGAEVIVFSLVVKK